MKFYTFLLVTTILLISGCAGNNTKSEGVSITACCLDSLEYRLIDSGFSSPASIVLKLADCESVGKTTISSIEFPHVQITDDAYFEVWAAQTDSIESPNTVFISVYTNNFEDSDLSKGSIEDLLSKQIKIITAKKDTIYISPCH